PAKSATPVTARTRTSRRLMRPPSSLCRTWATSCIHTRHSYAQTFGLGRERDREVTTAQQDSRRVAHPRTPGLAGPTAVGANRAAGGRRRCKPCGGRVAPGNQRPPHHPPPPPAPDRP